MDRWGQFNTIIEDENLDIKEKGLLLIIFRYINHKTGYANPSRTLIKKLTGISDNRTLDKIFDSLIDKGYLIRESGKGIRSRYFIKVGGEITPSGEITPTLGGEITPQKEKEKKKEKKNIYIENQNISVIYMNLSFIDDCITDVKITEEEYNNLIEKYPKKLVHDKIEALEIYKDLDKYKDHYKVLNNWCKKDKDKEEYKEQLNDEKPKADTYAETKEGYEQEDKYAMYKPKEPPVWVKDWT